LLLPAQDYVGQFLLTFKEYPQRQKAARFNLDEVLQKRQESPTKSASAFHRGRASRPTALRFSNP